MVRVGSLLSFRVWVHVFILLAGTICNLRLVCAEMILTFSTRVSFFFFFFFLDVAPLKRPILAHRYDSSL